MPVFGFSLLLQHFKDTIFKDGKSSFEFYKNETAQNHYLFRINPFFCFLYSGNSWLKEIA